MRALAALKLDRGNIAGLIKKLNIDIASNERDYTSLVEKLFFAARCGGIPEDGLRRTTMERFRVPSFQGDGHPIKTLRSLVDRAVAEDRWIVFSFHGIGGGHSLFCRQQDFEEFVAFLALDKRIQVKTFLDAAKKQWS